MAGAAEAIPPTVASLQEEAERNYWVVNKASGNVRGGVTSTKALIDASLRGCSCRNWEGHCDSESCKVGGKGVNIVFLRGSTES